MALPPFQEPDLIGGDDGASDDRVGEIRGAIMACQSSISSCNSTIGIRCVAYCENRVEPGCVGICKNQYDYIEDVTSECTHRVDKGRATASTCSNLPPEPGSDKISVGGLPKPKPGDNSQEKDSPAPKDSAKCDSALSATSRVCRRQPSFQQAANMGGVNGACQQAKTNSENEGQAWNNIIDNCSSAIYDCKQACSDTARCESYLDDLEYAQEQQTAAFQRAGEAGLGCGQQAGMNPSSNNPSNDKNKDNRRDDNRLSSLNNGRSDGIDCTNPVNISNSKCNPYADSAAGKDKAANLNPTHNRADRDASPSSFNTADASDVTTGQQGGLFPSLGEGAQPASSSGVQQGGGGGPMGGGSSSGYTPPSQGGGAAAAGRGLASTGAGDILKGERSGGGYNYGGSADQRDRRRRFNGGMNIGSLGMGRGRGTASDGTGRNMQGLDLKAYLPGGRYDGTRRSAGLSATHPDIHDSRKNMFAEVGNRMRVRCKLKQLYGCK